MVTRNGRGATAADLDRQTETINRRIDDRTDAITTVIEQSMAGIRREMAAEQLRVNERFKEVDQTLKERTTSNRWFDLGAAGAGGVLAYLIKKIGI